MKNLVYFTSFLGAFLLAASLAFAHGGDYSGPGGSGTGTGFSPSGGGTPGPGPGPGGSTGGGPGGGGTTGGTPGGGTGGGQGPGGGAPGGGAPGGAGPSFGGSTPGGGTKKANDNTTTWAAWWFFNDDQYLNLKAKVRRQDAETENVDIFLGDATVNDATNRLSAKKIRDQVNPALKLALKDDFFDTRAAAAIALGKTGMPDALESIKSVLADRDKRVRESACLAMGILGNKEAIPTLIAIFNDTPEMRKSMRDGGDILPRTRAFAALAMGLIGMREDISDTQAEGELLKALKDKKFGKTHVDLVVAPAVALGLMRSTKAVPELTNYLTDRENDSIARSYVATTLGKIGDRSVIADLVELMKKDKQNAVVQSCAIALGSLVTPDESGKDAIKALQDMTRTGGDLAAKNFSIISLGKIGGDENRTFLARLVDKGNNSEKAFAAIALGVYYYDADGQTKAFKKEVAETLLKAFNGTKNPEERGAYAVAMGLMKHQEAGAEILEELKDGGQASFRSHLAIALGLMEYTPAIEHVREIVQERGDVDLRRNAAISLGLLGDRGAMAFLMKEIEESESSLPVLGAVTQGLGFIGDASAAERLIEMATKNDKDNVRAFAAVALGLLGDKDQIPVLSHISRDNNFINRTDAIGEVLTIL